MSIEERLASGEYSQVECYEIGYKEAIDNACKEFQDCITQIGLDYNLTDDYMEHKCNVFRKAMEG